MTTPRLPSPAPSSANDTACRIRPILPDLPAACLPGVAEHLRLLRDHAARLDPRPDRMAP